MKLLKTFSIYPVLALLLTTTVGASIPSDAPVTNDPSIYESLREIKITPIKSINFDSDIAKLSHEEKNHREIPLRLTTPMERINKTPYHPTISSPQAKTQPAKHRSSETAGRFNKNSWQSQAH